MSKKITVSVTKNDIKNGKKCCDDSCPIALALKRKFKIQKKNDISVGSLIWLSEETEIGGTYTHSQESRLFMYNFDADLKVKPAKFVFSNIRL